MKITYFKIFVYTVITMLIFSNKHYSQAELDITNVVKTWDNGDKAFLNKNYEVAYYIYDSALQNLKVLDKGLKDNKSKYAAKMIKKRINLVKLYREFKVVEGVLKYAKSLMKEKKWNSALRQLNYIYEKIYHNPHVNLIKDMRRVIKIGMKEYLTIQLRNEIEERKQQLENIPHPKNIYVYNFYIKPKSKAPKISSSSIPDAILTYFQVFLESTNDESTSLALRQVKKMKQRISPSDFVNMRKNSIDLAIIGNIKALGNKIQVECVLYDTATELPVIKAKIEGVDLNKIKNFMETISREMAKILKTYKRKRYFRTFIYNISNVEQANVGEIQMHQLNCTPGPLIEQPKYKTYAKLIYLHNVKEYINKCEKELLYYENNLTFKGFGVIADSDMGKVLERYSFPAFVLTYKFNFPYKKYYRVLFEVDFGYFRTDSSKETFPYHSTVMHTFYMFFSSTIKIPLDVKRRIFIYPKLGFGFMIHDTLFHKNVWQEPVLPGTEAYNKEKVVAGAMKIGFEINIGFNAVWGVTISYDFIWGRDNGGTNEVYHLPLFGIFMRL